MIEVDRGRRRRGGRRFGRRPPRRIPAVAAAASVPIGEQDGGREASEAVFMDERIRRDVGCSMSTPSPNPRRRIVRTTRSDSATVPGACRTTCGGRSPAAAGRAAERQQGLDEGRAGLAISAIRRFGPDAMTRRRDDRRSFDRVGDVLVTADETRSQADNRELCLSRLKAVITAATTRPKVRKKTSRAAAPRNAASRRSGSRARKAAAELEARRLIGRGFSSRPHHTGTPLAAGEGVCVA